MKTINQFIKEGLKINSKSKVNIYNYHPKDKKELKSLIKDLIHERGNEANLNDIDTSKITDMSSVFLYSDFNGDISKWDVSNVEDMITMFYKSSFNGDISQWDVSKVKNMYGMFYKSSFNGDIFKWNVSNVTNMKYAFDDCPLEKNPPKWYKK